MRFILALNTEWVKRKTMKYQLAYAEIYITNVCNYSCTHCQSLNNFAFKGHQRWHDYQAEYTALSNRIDITTIQIIGGEPTLNPDFEIWVDGISKLWPNSKLQIATNGSRLDKLNSNIYKILSRNNGTLWLTCHNLEIYNSMLIFAKQFLDEIVDDYQPDKDANENWKISYDSIRQESWPTCDTIEQFVDLPNGIRTEIIEVHRLNPQLHLKTVPRMLIDKNGVEVKLDWAQTFVSSAIKVIDQQQMTMKYNSDPTEAHDNCHFKTCHQINKGKLYKCPLVSVLPDFLNQFDVGMTDSDKELAGSYKPAADTDDNFAEFVDNISSPIPQCKFCPTKYTRHNFVGTDKKIKIVPIS